VNFKGNSIRLYFDEFVDLQDVSRNLLFTPLFENVPVIEAKLRTLTLRIRDTLEPNTTYTFNFGNAIKDINEGNVLRNFTYTFSTGPSLDSLTLSGKVLLAESGKIDTTLIVVLHRNLADSAVRKERPRYVTRLNGSGGFTFRNLPAGTFAIYAMSDLGGTRRYQTETQLFAFTDAPIVISDTTRDITLYASREQAAPVTAAITPSRTNAADRRLRFTTNVANNQQSLLDSLKITFEQPLRSFDAARVTLFTDSVFNQITAFTTQLDSAKKSMTLLTAWKPQTLYNLVLDKEFAEDTLGRKLLKSDTLFFTTRKLADYGALNIRIHNVDTALNPVLQFVQNDAVVFSAPLIGGRYTQNLFLPGEYDLRILYDANRNGRWDPGRFFGVRRNPERVQPITRKISVKAASDNDFDIQL
ncbi:MAG TPA: Ig-like domain-containing protein, partial [Chitinophagaceae bacterium]|nr:Ig-like domain-containing protein [Chitinophagaceae bacterium]